MVISELKSVPEVFEIWPQAGLQQMLSSLPLLYTEII